MNQIESITMNEPNAMHINNDDQQLFVCIVVDLLLLDFVCVVQHDSPRKCTACVCVCGLSSDYHHYPIPTVDYIRWPLEDSLGRTPSNKVTRI